MIKVSQAYQDLGEDHSRLLNLISILVSDQYNDVSVIVSDI